MSEAFEINKTIELLDLYCYSSSDNNRFDFHVLLA